MKKKSKRFVAIIMAAAMMISTVPFAAYTNEDSIPSAGGVFLTRL